MMMMSRRKEMKQPLGDVLSQVYNNRYALLGKIDLNQSSEMDALMYLKTKTITLTRQKAYSCVKQGAENLAAQINRPDITLGKLKFMCIVHLLDLNSAIHYSCGVHPKKVLQFLENHLIPDLISWDLQLDTREFDTFARYSVAYLKNWCISTSIEDQQVIEKLKAEITAQEFKNAVLNECPSYLSHQICQSYRLGNDRLHHLLVPLLKLWGVRIDFETSVLVELKQLAVYAGVDALNKSIEAISTRMREIKTDDEVESGDWAPPEELEQTWTEAMGQSSAAFRKLYAAVVVIHAFQLQDEIYHSQHQASFDSVFDLLKYLWKSYWL